MTPAEKRIEEQVERWLASLDLHLQYVDLPDQAYNRAQPWPVHDRPSKLAIELARQKTLELLDMLAARRTAGDSKFADAMELMTYLANNVGLQPMQRFIPLADPAHHKIAAPAQSAPTPSPVAPPQRVAATPTPAPSTPAVTAYGAPNFDDEYDEPADAEEQEISVEIETDDPDPPPAPQPPPRPTTIVTAAPGRRVEPPSSPPVHPTPPPIAKPAQTPAPRPAAAPPPPPAPTARAPANKAPPPAKQPAAQKVNASDKEQQTVISDAVRLMAWGKSWHELAEAIARMANRPPIADVRRILRAHRAEIERLAAETKPE